MLKDQSMNAVDNILLGALCGLGASCMGGVFAMITAGKGAGK